MTKNTEPAGLSSSLPTREQIAETLGRADLNPLNEVTWTGTPPWMVEYYLSRADAVLALLQKGADRG